ncbi:MAG: T9SS type A sorting domain-containing protein, partial [Bacteroidota bacterium]|nr:T9SS type A sorting domain-containing protein [Bacteroidota bacterium]
LLAVRSSSLFSINPKDSISHPTPIPFAVVAAYSKIGKGKIIVIADYDIWWNGFPDDTTRSVGILSAKNFRFAFNIFGSIDNLLAQLPQPTSQEAYKIISIPFSFADSSVEALFKDLGPPNDLVWRMFGRWNEQKRAYEEFPKDFKLIRRGEGYWLITKQSKKINFGTASAQGSEDDFEIKLQPGYNLVGNPFPYRVSWANSFRPSGVEKVLWKFDKSFDTTSVYMEPFQGYFVKNRDSIPHTIKISSLEVLSPTTLPKETQPTVQLQPNEWKLQLIAQTPKSIDAMNYVGMLDRTANTLDDEDISEPPTAPTDYVALSLKNTTGALAADYRAFSPHGQYWDGEIATSVSNVPFTISMKKVSAMPSSFGIYLIDFLQEHIYDVTQTLSYSAAFNKKEYRRAFRLIVGDKEFLEKNTAGIPILPLEYSLDQNYPNPFNPTTSIRYSLAHSANVKLEIFNILGQKVKTLVESFQQIGTYTIQWNGVDEQQKPVATGMYYYRLSANEFNNIKKMTLIK